jgi:hypothetical protein
MQTLPSSPKSDAIFDQERSTTSRPSSRGALTLLFPRKLQLMLHKCTTDNKESIVSWVSRGKAFKVYNIPIFVSEILPLFFKQTKYKSFQRQLNLWGFERIQHGPQKGAYYNIQFLRDKPNLCENITRQRSKKSRPSKMGRVPSRIPRMVSEGSFEDFEDMRGRLDSNAYDKFDLVDFEGSTFHLLEQDRYEELNLEIDFASPPVSPESESEMSLHVKIDSPPIFRENKKSALLEELEQGIFGMPKNEIRYRGMNP